MRSNHNVYLESDEWFQLIIRELASQNSPEDTLKLQHELQNNDDLRQAIRIIRQNRQIIGRENRSQRLRYAFEKQVESPNPSLEEKKEPPKPGKRWFISSVWRNTNLYAKAAILILLVGLGWLAQHLYRQTAETNSWKQLAQTESQQVNKYVWANLEKPIDVSVAMKGDPVGESQVDLLLSILGKDTFTSQEIDQLGLNVGGDVAGVLTLYRGIAYLFAVDPNPTKAATYLAQVRQSGSDRLKWIATFYLSNAYLLNGQYESGIHLLQELIDNRDVQESIQQKAEAQLLFMEDLRKKNI